MQKKNTRKRYNYKLNLAANFRAHEFAKTKM